MRAGLTNVELTNMVMVSDLERGLVLALERVKDWAGLSFPGGRVEPGESFVDSAVREVLEETGLLIRNLKGCGVIHWTNLDNHDRYLSFLYKTDKFSGNLIPSTDEGRNIWMTVDALRTAPSKNGLHEILHMFLHDEFSEAFGSWDSGGNWRITEFK